MGGITRTIAVTQIPPDAAWIGVVSTGRRASAYPVLALIVRTAEDPEDPEDDDEIFPNVHAEIRAVYIRDDGTPSGAAKIGGYCYGNGNISGALALGSDGDEAIDAAERLARKYASCTSA